MAKNGTLKNLTGEIVYPKTTSNQVTYTRNGKESTVQQTLNELIDGSYVPGEGGEPIGVLTLAQEAYNLASESYSKADDSYNRADEAYNYADEINNSVNSVVSYTWNGYDHGLDQNYVGLEGAYSVASEAYSYAKQAYSMGSEMYHYQYYDKFTRTYYDGLSGAYTLATNIYNNIIRSKLYNVDELMEAFDGSYKNATIHTYNSYADCYSDTTTFYGANDLYSAVQALDSLAYEAYSKALTASNGITELNDPYNGATVAIYNPDEERYSGNETFYGTSQVYSAIQATANLAYDAYNQAATYGWNSDNGDYPSLDGFYYGVSGAYSVAETSYSYAVQLARVLFGDDVSGDYWYDKASGTDSDGYQVSGIEGAYRVAEGAFNYAQIIRNEVSDIFNVSGPQYNEPTSLSTNGIYALRARVDQGRVTLYWEKVEDITNNN